jgi:hypothetical protein
MTALDNATPVRDDNGAASPRPAVDPRRYFERANAGRSAAATQMPVCLYLETTNRCNLLCTTCPRTYEELEPPADMSWELFTRIVDQLPDIERAVLHGVGEPMLVKNLPMMVRYLKGRGAYVLFNTNGTLLNERNGRALIEAGLRHIRLQSHRGYAIRWRVEPGPVRCEQSLPIGGGESAAVAHLPGDRLIPSSVKFRQTN